MIYNIISTGSKGNAVIINDCILIDCGVSFKMLAPYIKDLKLVLLTHIHSDHFNKSTIKKLAFERPTLRFGCCEWLVGELVDLVPKKNIDVFETDMLFQYPMFCDIIANKTIHNADNCAYHIFQNGEWLFYATDTNSLDGICAKGYDLYMVEANYTEDDIVNRIKSKQEKGQYCYEWDVLKNHLSKEKAENWIYMQAGHKSKYVFLHGHENKNEENNYEQIKKGQYRICD